MPTTLVRVFVVYAIERFVADTVPFVTEADTDAESARGTSSETLPLTRLRAHDPFSGKYTFPLMVPLVTVTFTLPVMSRFR